MKRKNKFSLLRRSAIAVCALLATVAFVGCKGKGDGRTSDYGASYELTAGQSVTFYLDNIQTSVKGVGTTYLRLKDVYFNVTISDATGEGSLKLDRSPTATGTQTSYRYQFESGEKLTKQWIALTDEINKHDYAFLNVSSYHFYRLTAENCNITINEVIFYGEKLTKSSGDPTGEYCLVPARIYSAKPMVGETQDEADARAGALLDRQNASFEQIEKLKENQK